MISDSETLSRVLNKCKKIDRLLADMGKPPAAEEFLKSLLNPLKGMSHNAKEAQAIETAVDGCMIALKVLRKP